MDTYGDMVTLLLCFFVLLYSISSVDQSKWIKLVESFNPDAKEVSQIVTDTVADGNDEVPGGAEAAEQAFDDLYERLQTSSQQRLPRPKMLFRRFRYWDTQHRRFRTDKIMWKATECSLQKEPRR